MPVYDYYCQACGETFEKKVKFEEADAVECPKCRTKARRKLTKVAVKTSGGSTPSVSYSNPAPGGL
ncbi:MAG: hypothetical protein OHK0023_27740 [Anaerolineae bacterium]